MSIIPEPQEQNKNVIDEIIKADDKPLAEEPTVEAIEGPKPEVKPEEEAKEVPFHKHPRWIAKQQREEEMASKIASLEEQLKNNRTPAKQEEQKMPESFAKLFGSNEEAWAEWQKLGLVTKDDMQSEFRRIQEEQQAETQKVEEANKKAVQWAEDQFITLSDDTGIDFTIGTPRNMILDFIEKKNLYDAKGLPNIALAHELLSEMGKFDESTDLVDEKKRVASKTGTKTNSSTKESDVMTPKKLEAIRKAGGIYSFLN